MCEYAKYLSLIGRVVAITAGARGIADSLLLSRWVFALSDGQ
ncbi:MAG: hypothetical protein ACI9MZ_001420 [Porticoccaceae bacterium]|jgi:hypothetical protein